MRFTLPLRPISVNNMYYGNRKLGKTAAAKDWSYQMNWEISKHAAEFVKLREAFDPKKHGLKMELTFYYADFFNMERKISSKVYDLSNVEKPLIDLLVTRQNHGAPPYKAHNLNVDDKYLVDLISKKRPGPTDSIEVIIEIVELPLR